jgi:hypothetical protein
VKHIVPISLVIVLILLAVCTSAQPAQAQDAPCPATMWGPTDVPITWVLLWWTGTEWIDNVAGTPWEHCVIDMPHPVLPWETVDYPFRTYLPITQK